MVNVQKVEEVDNFMGPDWSKMAPYRQYSRPIELAGTLITNASFWEGGRKGGREGRDGGRERGREGGTERGRD